VWVPDGRSNNGWQRSEHFTLCGDVIYDFGDGTIVCMLPAYLRGGGRS